MDSNFGFTSDMFSGRALLGEDSSVMARMEKKFWKTKQVLIKATGKKEDEHVVASDADLDAKLEFFRSVQTTCTELLKMIEKYQQRITCLSQEENQLGVFLCFQAEHDRTKAGHMMEVTGKALCAAANMRLALCPPLLRMEQEVETFRRRAIADSLLTVGHMERARTEYRGALLWMKDVSQELDPDTYKQLEKFRKVQAQVRNTKGQFDKLKNDVCQKVDMLGASRCNMLSHSLCTYQTTLLHFWEKTANTMSKIQETFGGNVPYQFTTLKDVRDPHKKQTEGQAQLQGDVNTVQLVSLDDEVSGDSASVSDALEMPPGQEKRDVSFLNELLSPDPPGADDFSRMWLETFGCFEPGPSPSAAAPTSPQAPPLCQPPSPSAAAPTSPQAPPHSQPPSPTGFLPSQLLDLSLSSTGWATPPMFQAPPLQPPQPAGQAPPTHIAATTADVPRGSGRDMSAWFNLFADLDPLSNPDAIGHHNEELLHA